MNKITQNNFASLKPEKNGPKIKKSPTPDINKNGVNLNYVDIDKRINMMFESKKDNIQNPEAHFRNLGHPRKPQKNSQKTQNLENQKTPKKKPDLQYIDSIYKNGFAIKLAKERQAQEHARKNQKKELHECTFKPHLNANNSFNIPQNFDHRQEIWL